MQTQPRTAFKQWKMIILFSLLRQEYLTDDYLLLPLKTPFLQDDKCEFPKAGKCFLGKKKKTISWNCPYHFIYKYIGHMLIIYCPFQPHLPTENNQGSGDTFDV